MPPAHPMLKQRFSFRTLHTSSFIYLKLPCCHWSKLWRRSSHCVRPGKQNMPNMRQLCSRTKALKKHSRGPARIKCPTDLHSHLQHRRGPEWAADRWLCCLGCLLQWLTRFWMGLAQWRVSHNPAGLSGNGLRLWSGNADQLLLHQPPQCPHFDIPCPSTWGCTLSVPSGHRLQKAAEKHHEVKRRPDWIHKNHYAGPKPKRKKTEWYKHDLTVLHLVPHTTCLWFSHWDAKTLLSCLRENSLSLRIHGSLPAAKPRRLRSSLNSCCCWGLNSRPLRAHTTEWRLYHHCWAWRDEQETRLLLCGVWHHSSWGKRESGFHLTKYVNNTNFPHGGRVGWGWIIKCYWTKTNICQYRWPLHF